jgi:hypothetical protein
MSDEKRGDEENAPFSFVDKRRRHEEDGVDETPQPTTDDRDMSAADDDDYAAVSAAADDEKNRAEAPPLDFATFILSLSSSAAYYLGAYTDPTSGKTSIDLGQAKQTIDMLAILEEKTRGNLSDDEHRLLTHVLHDLRMRFVELARK